MKEQKIIGVIGDANLASAALVVDPVTAQQVVGIITWMC